MNPKLKKFSQLDMKQVLMIGVGLAILYYIALYDGGESIDAQVANIETQIQQEEQRQTETNKLIKEVEGLTTQINEKKTKFDALMKKLPANTNATIVSQLIESIASETGVRIVQVRQTTIDRGDIVEEIPVSVVAEGGFNDFAFFIYKLSKEDIFLRATRLSIKNSEKNDFTKGKLRMDATIASFKYIGDKEKKATEGSKK